MIHSLHFPCLSSCNLKHDSNKSNRRNQIHRKPKLPFVKPAQKQLLTNQDINSHSKLQALETVIRKVETSAKNGIEISDPQIFASLLETCFQLQAIDHGIRVHRHIPEKLLRKNVGISSKLMRLYACTGHIEEAHQIFDQMPKRNSLAFPWNSLISGYAEKGMNEDALALYFQMVEEGVEPDQYTFPRVLKACGGVGMIHVGEEVHRHVIRCGFGSNGFTCNALIDMYAKCGDIIRARRVFDAIKVRDLVSWNSMIIGYIRHDLLGEALDIFRWMFREGCVPDPITLSAILTSMPAHNIGAQIYGWALRRGVELKLSIANSLLAFYSNQTKLERVRWLFENMPEKDIVSWNSIISAFSRDPKVLEYFKQMVSVGVSPDAITFMSLLSACAHLGMVKDGEKLFLMMKERYRISPVMEHYACMVNLYARAGLLDDAYDFIVNRMEFEAGRTVWGALLYGCSIHGNVDIGEIAAKSLFDLEPDNEHNFELLMKIYHDANRADDVERIKVMMMERGLNF